MDQQCNAILKHWIMLNVPNVTLNIALSL